eukprot:CAMPEP_0172409690 /NCGR_PEP_ID=MMETSP1061-20121228/76497_1 /TAXON_ID=37318 /ORGANISM="Pseudo-nitzschia pungens, Strain cf. pungens" /LENGTH=491 /DNA_ID=CAMNT_0013145851 /DNA_START=51 /DNA_END=1526 /DNA_ORIENTATION=+
MMFRLLIAIALSLRIHFTETDAFSSIAIASSHRSCTTRSTSLDSANPSKSGDALPAGTPTIRVRAAVYQPPLAETDASATNTETTTHDDTNPLAVLTEIADVLNMASRCGIDLVQFPEYFLSGGDERVRRALLDRDASTLNIVGNLCAELGVACIIGYAEREHESEGSDSNASEAYYNALALFHADGSRAGNYRCVHPIGDGGDSDSAKPGHPLVEAIPIALRLPDRGEDATGRELKVGPLCGNDALMPEHARHLTRSGAQVLVVAGFACDAVVAEAVLPTRSIENGLPLLFSNYCGIDPHEDADDDAGDDDDDEDDDEDDDDADGNEEHRTIRDVGGRSAVVSPTGADLVRAPTSANGDMPASDGYLLPCGGSGGGGAGGAALYAADVDVPVHDDSNDNDDDDDHDHDHNGGGKVPSSSPRKASLDEWDLAPRIAGLGTQQHNNDEGSSHANRTSRGRGFGREVVELLEQQQQQQQTAKRNKRKRASKRK